MKNRTSTPRDRLKWAARSGIPVLLAVLLLAGAAWLALPRWGRPPVLRADGVLYQAPNTYTLEAQGDLTYLGEVAGVVARHRMPEKELWANHDIAGRRRLPAGGRQSGCFGAGRPMVCLPCT